MECNEYVFIIRRRVSKPIISQRNSCLHPHIVDLTKYFLVFKVYGMLEWSYAIIFDTLLFRAALSNILIINIKFFQIKEKNHKW
jgi:hypothetical protein